MGYKPEKSKMATVACQTSNDAEKVLNLSLKDASASRWQTKVGQKEKPRGWPNSARHVLCLINKDAALAAELCIRINNVQGMDESVLKDEIQQNCGIELPVNAHIPK